MDEIVRGDEAGGRAPCPEAEIIMGVLAYVAPDAIPEFLLAPLHSGDGGAAMMSESRFDAALEELAGASLVTWGAFEDGAPRLGVHRLVQDIMRARLAANELTAKTTALVTRLGESTYAGQLTFDGLEHNARLFPHAVALSEHAPQSGDAAHSTFWLFVQLGGNKP